MGERVTGDSPWLVCMDGQRRMERPRGSWKRKKQESGEIS